MLFDGASSPLFSTITEFSNKYDKLLNAELMPARSSAM